MKAIKNILVTGAEGLLGSEFSEISRGKNPDFSIQVRTHPQLDITNPEQVAKAFSEINPDYVVNCAAYTDVDGAESDRETAWRANVEGTQLLAKFCAKNRSKLVHFSSDSIFNGEKDAPYVESDLPSPIGFYGLTKLESERVIASELPPSDFLILRITWPYGRHGTNFINKAIKDLPELPTSTELRAVVDQIGTPSPAKLLAKSTLTLMQDGTSGIFHLSCTGQCSKFEFIAFLLKHTGSSCKVSPAKMEDFPAKARRPKNSVLITERKPIFEKLNIPSWQQALTEYLETHLKP